MRAPDGSKHWLHGEFEEISPHDFLSMSWVWEASDLAGHEMLVSITFTAVGQATEIKLTHSNLPGKTPWRRIMTAGSAHSNVPTKP